MSLPDHSDIPDHAVDLLAQRREIGLPSKGGTINEKHLAPVYPSIEKAIADAMPPAKSRPLTRWQMALIVAAPGGIFAVGWLIAHLIDFFAWNAGRLWGSF